MPKLISPDEGRNLFGSDAGTYHAARPPYPEPVYELLQTAGALHRGVATLEVGAGNGLATRRLLELGADPITVIEPDTRFAPLLSALATPHAATIQVLHVSFEEAQLAPQSFDLLVSATALHWVRPEVRMDKSARLLRPAGHLAIWWNVFGDPDRRDPFREATSALLQDLPASPSRGYGGTSFALDRTTRLQEIIDSGAFDAPSCDLFRWSLRLSAQQVAALYATFSSISSLPADERRRILEQLIIITERDFGGTVERPMVTPVYLARRKAGG